MWQTTLTKKATQTTYQLMRAVGNPYEATLYRRTRAERISLMFLFHLTLILQKELQVREGPCVSVRVRWSGTESSITSVSHCDACAHQAHTLSSLLALSRHVLCSHTETAEQILHILHIAEHTHTHTVQSGSSVERSAALDEVIHHPPTQ